MCKIKHNGCTVSLHGGKSILVLRKKKKENIIGYVIFVCIYVYACIYGAIDVVCDLE